MKCGLCKHPLRKVSSRTVNKRRVPIYAKCPRLDEPQFHPARSRSAASENDPKALDQMPGEQP